MLTGFVQVRRVGISLVTAIAFSGFSMASALANTPVGGAPLPAPTSLVLYEPAGAPADAPAPQADRAAPIDVPTAVPAPGGALVGKMVLVLLGLVALIVVISIAIAAVVLWDLFTNNE